ncbi:ABC transporter substrate-binding protein [Rhodobacteraceae bacterium NNCM2]|nr:ABC transporter substrate-binding protein [Coraliihabitans acroporae]
MTKLRRIAIALLAALPLQFAHAAEEEAATEVATTLVNQAHEALTTPGSEAERNEMLRAALEQAFEFDIWERFLIDEKKKEQFSEVQMDEFRALLPGFLANLYANQFGKGLEAKPVIKGARTARKDVLVSADIPRANGKNLPVDWRVRDFGADGGYRVIDVMVGGTSFLRLKRDEFNALLDAQGPEALLEYMRQNAV